MCMNSLIKISVPILDSKDKKLHMFEQKGPIDYVKWKWTDLLSFPLPMPSDKKNLVSGGKIYVLHLAL